MPIIPMNEILKDAKEKKYAVGCYNAINLDMARGVIKAAEEKRSPVILCHAELHFKYTPLEIIGPILIDLAKKSKIPVAILLDHGKDFDTIIRAMNLGFNGIMYDGSSLSYEENKSNTKEIVKIAKALGISVEAELGHVTRPKSGGAEGEEDDEIIDNTDLYTDSQQAQEFVEETGIDALAVAFGTVHGIYLKKPRLDLSRLSQISERVDVPLVMHGGSGLTEEDFKGSIENGICKINYYTGMALYCANEISKYIKENKRVFYHQIMMVAIDAFTQDVKRTMDIFGSCDKA
jgi:fructose-bisphosphate aldolase class II